MASIVPGQISVIEESQISLVHDIRRPQGQPSALSAHQTRGHPAKLGVDEGDELFQGLVTTISKLPEQAGDLAAGCGPGGVGMVDRVLDACLGDDTAGDGDQDGICADRDCNDADPGNGCAIFDDGFESQDTSAWSATIGLGG